MALVEKPPIPDPPASWREVTDELGFGRMHFDRDGEPISLWEWCMLSESRDYKIVKRTRVGHAEVSTVWLGIDHGWGMSDVPVIFETMIFATEPTRGKLLGRDREWHEADEFQERYTTEEEALRRHDEIVEFLTLG